MTKPCSQYPRQGSTLVMMDKIFWSFSEQGVSRGIVSGEVRGATVAPNLIIILGLVQPK